MARFVSMLMWRSIYFAPASTFSDPFEGSLPRLDDRRFRAIVRESPAVRDAVKMNRRKLAAFRRALKAWHVDARHEHMVSCWHMSEHESAAMWQLYGPSGGTVAVRTTVAKLNASLGPQMMAGAVTYIDYDKGSLPFEPTQLPRDDLDRFTFPTLRYFVKRRSFEHEREYRAILKFTPKRAAQRRAAKGLGVNYFVNLAALIDQVHISPNAQEWIWLVVQNLCMKYDLDKPVVFSSMDRSPLF